MATSNILLYTRQNARTELDNSTSNVTDFREISGVDPTTAAGTGFENAEAEDHYVPSCVVILATVICSFFLLTALKVAILACMKATAGQGVPNWAYTGEDQQDNPDWVKNTKRKHALSELPGDLLLYPTGALVALYQIHGTDLIRRPWTTMTPTLLIILSTCLGNLLYRLTTSLIRPRMCNLKWNMTHYMVAIATYITIVTTKEDAMLGVIGMVMQLPFLFLTTRSAMRNKSDYPCLYTVNNLLFAGGAALCLICLPVAYISLALHFSCTPPYSMTYVSFVVFIISVIYFGFVNIWTIKAIICSICCFRSDLTLPCSEYTPLLKQNPAIDNNSQAAALPIKIGKGHDQLISNLQTTVQMNMTNEDDIKTIPIEVV